MSKHERKHNVSISASPNQLTEIQILISHHKALTRQLLIPGSILITASLPYWINLVMTPGSALHNLYISLLSIINPQNFEARLSDPLLDSSSQSLTAHQKTAINLLTQFHEVFLKKLKVTDILSAAGIAVSVDARALLTMEAEILETQKLFLHTEPPMEIPVTVPKEIKEEVREKFVRTIMSLNTAAKSPVVKVASGYQVESSIKNEKINKNIVMTIPRQWLNKNFFELAELLSQSYYNLVNEVNMPQSQIAQLTLIELMMAQDGTSWHLIWLSILLGYFGHHLIIYPTIKTLYQKRYGDQQIIDLTKGYLSEQKAGQVIQVLSGKNKRMEQRVSVIYLLFGKILPLLFFAAGIYDYYQTGRISPALLLSGLCAFSAFAYDGCKMALSSYENRTLDKTIERMRKNLNLAVACTDETWEITQGRWLSESYFTYQARKYRALSAGRVNETVKDIFISYGATILSSGKTMINMAPLLLTHAQIIAINQRIRNYLEKLIALHQLKQQLQQYFYESDIFEAGKLDAQNLPLGEFIINCSDVSRFDMRGIKPLFPECQLEYREPYLIITGNTAVDDKAFQPEKLRYSKPSADIKQENKDPASPKTDSAPEPAAAPKEKSKTKSVFPNLSQFIDDKFGEDKRVMIQWSPTLTYDSRQRQGSIKPIDHPIYREIHFVRFAIPEERFPSASDYKTAKDKVESGQLAKSEKNSQGLQFRPGQAVDHTVPGNRTFQYELRAKLLGANGKGKIRLFSEPRRIRITNKAGKEATATVHEFKSAMEVH